MPLEVNINLLTWFMLHSWKSFKSCFASTLWSFTILSSSDLNKTATSWNINNNALQFCKNLLHKIWSQEINLHFVIIF